MTLEFRWMSKHQRRALVRELRNEMSRCSDREQLLVRARQWLYEHGLLSVRNPAIRTLGSPAKHSTRQVSEGLELNKNGRCQFQE